MEGTVAGAVAALREFGGEYLNKYEAGELLDLWRHGADLTTDDIKEVLDAFPLPPVPRPSVAAEAATPERAPDSIGWEW